MPPKFVNKGLCDERTTEIKKDLESIEGKLDKIRTNDLLHINKQLAVLEERLNSRKELYGVIASLVASIASVILWFIQVVI